MLQVRDATVDDDAALAAVAAEGGSADTDPAHFAFVRASGRLRCAVDGGEVVAMGGMVAVGGAAMVTDLFVAAARRGAGIGRAVLGSLLDGWPHRMTFSSTHAAALPAYAREGMVPRWQLHYLTGRAIGGGLPLVPAPWGHDRAELVAHFAAGGSFVSRDLVVHAGPRGVLVQRMVSDEPEATLQWLLEALPSGTTVWCRAPEHHRAAHFLRDHGFWVQEHDVFCASEGVALDPLLGCVHPGLC